MENENVEQLVRDVGTLVSCPDVFIRINQLIEDPTSTIDSITKVISQDPSFTARLLHIANSPFYGFSSTIETVSRAVTLIGTNQVRHLALSTSISRTFAGLPNELVSVNNFWQHSLYCALASRAIGKRVRRVDPEAVFTAGLLHDIGELLIFNRLPVQARAALELVLDSGDELPVHLAERQIMGLDHAQVGAALARRWGLPPMLCECIECHHGIQQAQQFPRETAVVHIANALALMAEIDTLDVADVPPLDPLAWEIVGLQASDIVEPTIRQAQQEIGEVKRHFFGA